MSQIFFNETDLIRMHTRTAGVLTPEAYSMRSPLPQVLLITGQESAANGVYARTTTLTPLSWVPYTMAVCISSDDKKILAALKQKDATCVLALPTREMVRETAICAQLLPVGISEARVARLRLFRSQYILPPSIENCPVNFECRVLTIESYHGSWVVFLKVVGASIDPSLLFASRQEITALFPTNYVDDVIDSDGKVRRRVGLMGEMFLCPTFPVAPKQGWYSTFEVWMKDLLDEGYLTNAEFKKAVDWSGRLKACFEDLDNPDRPHLRQNLTNLLRLIVHEDWDSLHRFLAD